MTDGTEITAHDSVQGEDIPEADYNVTLGDVRSDCLMIFAKAKFPIFDLSGVEIPYDGRFETDSNLQSNVFQSLVTALTDLEDGLLVTRKRKRLPDDATSLLECWAHEHRNSPFPSLGQRKNLSDKTGLTTKQIKDWFTNYRKRRWHEIDSRPDDASSASSHRR